MFFFYESFYKLDTNFEIAWLGTRFFGTKSRSSSVCCKTGISWRKIYVTKIEQWPKFSWRSKRMYKIHVLKWFWNTCWIYVIRFISLKNHRPLKVRLHWDRLLGNRQVGILTRGRQRAGSFRPVSGLPSPRIDHFDNSRLFGFLTF